MGKENAKKLVKDKVIEKIINMNEDEEEKKDPNQKQFFATEGQLYKMNRAKPADVPKPGPRDQIAQGVFH